MRNGFLLLLALFGTGLAGAQIAANPAAVIRYHYGDDARWAATDFDDSALANGSRGTYPHPAGRIRRVCMDSGTPRGQAPHTGTPCNSAVPARWRSTRRAALRQRRPTDRGRQRSDRNCPARVGESKLLAWIHLSLILAPAAMLIPVGAVLVLIWRRTRRRELTVFAAYLLGKLGAMSPAWIG